MLFSFHKTGGLSFPFGGLLPAMVSGGLLLVRVPDLAEELGDRCQRDRSPHTGARDDGRLRSQPDVAAACAPRSPSCSSYRSPTRPVPRHRDARVLCPHRGLGLSLKTVLIAHLVYVLPYFLLIALAVFSRLDVTLEETAADLGASPWTVFRRVTLPQIWPVLVAATVLAFALSFDEFIITFFVIGTDPTLPLFIWSRLRRTVDPSINTISTLLMLLTLVLWIVAFVFTIRAERSRRCALAGLAEEA